MDVYLSWQNNTDVVLLPVTPPTIGATYPGLNEVVNISRLGEYNIIGKTGLASISISSFFPKYQYSYCKTKPLETQSYIDYIQKWRNSGKPIRIIITGTDINMACSIENFEWNMGRTGDVNYSLELKEYRFIKIPQNQITVTDAGTKINIPETKREIKPIEKNYVVKSGDTLYGIAKKVTGDGANYKTIAKTNGITNPDKIKVGQKLVI